MIDTSASGIRNQSKFEFRFDEKKIPQQEDTLNWRIGLNKGVSRAGSWRPWVQPNISLGCSFGLPRRRPTGHGHGTWKSYLSSIRFVVHISSSVGDSCYGYNYIRDSAARGRQAYTYTQQHAFGAGGQWWDIHVSRSKEREDGKFNRFPNFNRRFLFNHRSN